MAYILLKVMCKFVLSVSYSEKQMPWGRDSHYERLRMPPSDSLIIRILASLLALGVQDKMPLFIVVKVSFTVALYEMIKNRCMSV